MSAAWQGPSTEADTAPDGGDSIMNLQDLVLLIAQRSCVITPRFSQKDLFMLRMDSYGSFTLLIFL
jgi:hypothetical protein